MPNEVPAFGTWSHTSFFAVRGAAVDGNGTPAAAQRSATVRVSVLGARGVAAMLAHGVASRGVSAGGCDAPNGAWGWSQRCVEA